MPQPEKMFIVRKYVLAPSAADAIKRESKQPVFDVWLDDDWKKANMLRKSDYSGNDAGIKP